MSLRIQLLALINDFTSMAIQLSRPVSFISALHDIFANSIGPIKNVFMAGDLIRSATNKLQLNYSRTLISQYVLLWFIPTLWNKQLIESSLYTDSKARYNEHTFKRMFTFLYRHRSFSLHRLYWKEGFGSWYSVYLPNWRGYKFVSWRQIRGPKSPVGT